MNNNTVSRRLFILLCTKITLLFILIIRLFFLQIKEGFYFQKLSEKNRINLVPIIPKRGIIYDNFSLTIAGSIFLWEALFIKSQLKTSINLFINTLDSIISLTSEEKAQIKTSYDKTPSHIPILIKQNLSQSEIAALETFSYNIPGVFIRPFYRRSYPYNEIYSHLLGYTSFTDDLSKTNNIPNWQIGRSGLELQFDSFLRGKTGYAKYEVNAKGIVIRKLEQTLSVPGNNINLTLDTELQEYTYKLLSDYNSASAVVLDLENGNILCMVSYPAFNPNLFVQGIPEKIWQELVNNEKSPLSNKPVQGLYPPGSTIKPIMALKGLQSKLITPETTVECKGYIDIGKNRFHCWKKSGHGIVNVSKALYESCDIFFYNLAQIMSIKEMSDVARDFGFSSKLLPLIPTEAKGKVLDEDKYNYQLGDRIISGIGQGRWLVTPLQLAYMASIIANDATIIVKPNILKSVEYADKIIYPKNNEQKYKLPYNPEYIHLVKQAFLDTIISKTGTGALARTYDQSWLLAGKTGTSQVRRISMEERKNGIISNYKLPWKLRDHGLFVGFVPYEKPLYSIAIVIEHGGGSSLTAAPLAAKIALKLKERSSFYISEKQKIKNILKS